MGARTARRPLPAARASGRRARARRGAGHARRRPSFGRPALLRRTSFERPPKWSLGRARRKRPQATPEPAPVATARATIVDPISLSAERQAHAWLADLDAEREARAAVAVLNRVLFTPIGSPPPIPTSTRSPRPGARDQGRLGRGGAGGRRPLAARARAALGADSSQIGRHAAAGYRRSLSGAAPPGAPRGAARRAGASLLCEDLALRARLDLDQGRLLHAAVELDGAFAAALPELRAEGRQDLAIRIAELEQLRGGVLLQARAARPDGSDTAGGEAARGPADPATGTGTAGSSGAPTEPEEEIVRHALERLEAALRARTATGFRLR